MSKDALKSFEDWYAGGWAIAYKGSAYHIAGAAWSYLMAIIEERDKEIAELEKDFDEIQADKIELSEHVIKQAEHIATLEAQLKRRCACEFSNGICVEPCKYHGEVEAQLQEKDNG